MCTKQISVWETLWPDEHWSFPHAPLSNPSSTKHGVIFSLLSSLGFFVAVKRSSFGARPTCVCFTLAESPAEPCLYSLRQGHLGRQPQQLFFFSLFHLGSCEIHALSESFGGGGGNISQDCHSVCLCGAAWGKVCGYERNNLLAQVIWLCSLWHSERRVRRARTDCFIVETKCHLRRVTVNMITWQPQRVCKQVYVNRGEMLLTLWVSRLLTAHLKVVMWSWYREEIFCWCHLHEYLNGT